MNDEKDDPLEIGRGFAVAGEAGGNTEDTENLPLGRVEVKLEADPQITRFTSALVIYFRKLRESLRS